jgi:hypothetical protein
MKVTYFILVFAFLLIVVLSDTIICDGPDWIDNINTMLGQVGDNDSPIGSEANPQPFGEPQDPVPGRRCPACLEKGDTV